MSKFSEKGYFVKENAPIYLTLDMDRTAKWFEEILGGIANTGGLLSDYTKDMSISPDTVLEILSTIYYKAMLHEEFRTDNTTQETFHGTKGDTTVDMMHKTDMIGRMKTGFLRK